MTGPMVGGDGVSVVLLGPLFDGRAARAAHEYAEQVERIVAEQGLANVQQYLDASIRHPTPYYETQIMMEATADSQVVHDRGIVYGPWLEGISRRNQTTRFKGYASFRRATQALRPRVDQLCAWVLRHGYLSRMGG